MPSTTNDLPFSGSPDLSGGDNNRGGAAGVEIPVTVHASRYSASSVGKSLPPVHEDTRTVIVFEQGAVVRLSAGMNQGELVVLTNKLTGADVICKVASVKAQAGTQNYVSLEFTQRAPGFWKESSSDAGAAAASIPASVVEAPSVVIRPDLSAQPPASQLAMQATRLSVPPERTQQKSQPAPLYLQTEQTPPPLAEPVSVTRSLPPTETLSPAQTGGSFSEGSSFANGNVSSPSLSSLRPVEFTTVSGSRSENVKKIALLVVAAVALVILGGLGGWLLLRPGKPATGIAQAVPPVPDGSQQAAASQPQTPAEPAVDSVSVEPQIITSGESEIAPLEPAPKSPAEAAPVASKLPKSPSSASLSAAPAAALAPSTPGSVGTIASSNASSAKSAERRTPIEVSKMSTPLKRAVASTSAEAPPELLAQAGVPAGGSMNDNLIMSSARSAGPMSPLSSGPAKGGQLVQPKLVSSPPALYPAPARASHIQGDVVIDAFIDEGGIVAATKVISGPPALQQSAMSAVRSWVYQPAKLNGQPISVHIRVTVSFHLQ